MKRIVAAFIALVGCGPDQGVTAPRVEAAVASTFANLVHVQQPRLGGAPVLASALRATATCTKTGALGEARGAGGWRCTVHWFLPGHAPAVQDTYDVQITADGCYTATADAADAHVGGPTLRAVGGAPVANLLYAFDGCFDTR